MKPQPSIRVRRRTFLKTAVAGTLTAAVPGVVTANKSGSQNILGQGDHKYRVHHAWPQLPDRFQWQTTHNVAVDGDGLLYVIHEGRENLKDHPSIFVFDPQGKYVRSFGQQFQGGGHGLEVRREGREQFLYVCAYQQVKALAKLSLRGEVVWLKHAPAASGVYAAGEDTDPQKIWGRDRFLPTNFAFLPDGDFLLADGYGSYYIHRYDRDGNWKSAFGGPGNGQGKFNTPHGIWWDDRPGREPAVVICDRAHHTLQYVTADGQHRETLEGFGLPANADTWQDLLVVPELFARVTLLDAKNQVVARLGDDAEHIRGDQKREIRANPTLWQEGKFVHPHDACFDGEGNIFVAEWVGTGRVSRLERLK